MFLPCTPSGSELGINTSEHVTLERNTLGDTSAGQGYSPGWKTPFSLGFSTEITNPELKVPPLVAFLVTGTKNGHLVLVCFTSRD